MIEKLIKTFTSGMDIQSTFNEKDFTLTTRTKFHGKLIHEHVSELAPMFEAFERRLRKPK